MPNFCLAKKYMSVKQYSGPNTKAHTTKLGEPETSLKNVYVTRQGFISYCCRRGPGPNFIDKHINLLSMKCFALIKTGYQPIFRISKQQLKTSNKQYITNGKLVGNPVFIK